MSTAITALLASTLAVATPAASTSPSELQLQDASLRYVSPSAVFLGFSYGITSVDNQTLILDQRVNAPVASGYRTVSYSCPNESGISQLGFNFEAGRSYELVCRAGQQAEIRTADC